ncbi:MAG: hypothetical protein Q8M94_21170, partial [Ignavibacteria bacterium]|nr:hypothetical protein [Ignavibacteria bacterium]
DKGFGISDKVTKRVGKKIAFVVCPLCCTSRKLSKTGGYYISRSKTRKPKSIGELIKPPRSRKYNPEKETRFNTYSFDEPFISIRESGGRGTGFREVEIIKMSDIPKLPKKDQKMLLDLIVELRGHCQKILDYTDKLVK